MITRPLTIRYAAPHDIPDLLAIFSQVVSPLDIYSEEARAGEIRKFSREEFEYRIEADPFAVTLAYSQNDLVGFSVTDDQHGPVWLEWYGVRLDARGAGAGEAIIRHLITELPIRHATKLWCDTRTSNTQSIRLFEKLNFRRLCEVKNHWYGQDFYLWEREL